MLKAYQNALVYAMQLWFRLMTHASSDSSLHTLIEQSSQLAAQQVPALQVLQSLCA